MKNDDNKNPTDNDVLKTSSEILSRNGKNNEEIKAFCEEQFPISSAIIDTKLESRQKNRLVKLVN